MNKKCTIQKVANEVLENVTKCIYLGETNKSNLHALEIKSRLIQFAFKNIMIKIS